MDNTALLAMNFDTFKQEMSIADVTEDEENYYVSYVFSTFDVKDYFWQNQNKTQTLKVSKDALKGRRRSRPLRSERTLSSNGRPACVS